ncbi:uncharacterized protein LOC129754049 [Uranotaenia lowii]|uniref:uncharacterized protein LOC129754049 n=1 Tax=Uranotaenia lowii TaxID=190385 RepID=UPI002478BBC9|nr:uncharacterized protein LOC129754049 [Uranotaenia lowii]
MENNGMLSNPDQLTCAEIATGNCHLCSGSDSLDNLVGCDECSVWAHYGCAGVSSAVEATDRSWKCERCKSKSNSDVPNKPKSRCSKRSSRAELELQKLKEEKDLQLKALEEEEKARREFQQKKTQIEAEYLRKKYVCIEASEEGSVKSRSSQGRSKQIVENWLEKSPTEPTPEFELPAQLSADHLPRLTDNIRSEKSIIPNVGTPEQCSLIPTSSSTPHSRQIRPTARTQPAPLISQNLRNYLDVIPPIVSGTTNTRLVPRVSFPNQGTFPKPAPNVASLGSWEAFNSISLSGKSLNQPPNAHGSPLSTITEESRLSDELQLNHAQSIPNCTPISLNFPSLPSQGDTLSQMRLPFTHSVEYQAGYAMPRAPQLLIDASASASANTFRPNISPITQPGSKVTWVSYPGTAVPIPSVSVNSPILPTAILHDAGPTTGDMFPQNTNLSLNPFKTNQVERSCGPTSAQLAARQTMQCRDLPNFSGDPEEWPLFFCTYKNSTEMCGYNNAENLARLQRCLTGQARESVKSQLLSPALVPEIIETLQMCYGRPELLIDAMLMTLRNTPCPKHENLQSIITYGLAVKNTVAYMMNAELVDHLSNPSLLKELVGKLPTQFQIEWSRFKRQSTKVNVATFGEYMSELVAVTADLVTPKNTGSLEKVGKTGRNNQKLFLHSDVQDTNTQETAIDDIAHQKACAYCVDPAHQVANCQLFQALDIDGRWKAIKRKGMCWTCLVPHKKWPCRSNKECRVDGCRSRHHVLLHSPSGTKPKDLSTQAQQKPPSETAHQNHHLTSSEAMFRYLPVTVFGPDKKIDTYAFLDDGSSSTLVEGSLAKELGVSGPRDTLWLTWTDNISREERESQRISLEISGRGMDNKFKIENIRTVKQLKLPSQSFDYLKMQKKYSHLKGLPLESYFDAVPKIIIGIDHVHLLTTLRVREGHSGDPVGTKTRLGWSVFGKQKEFELDEVGLNFHMESDQSAVGEDQSLHELMGNFFSLEDQVEHSTRETASEIRAREILEKTTTRIGKRFETGLLWKYDYRCFPDSYPTAERRLRGLEKRLAKDPQLEENVRQQVASYIEKGYAHLATNEELEQTNPDHVWYLPLGVVRNPKKPEKIRLIWDAAARTNGVSLNDMLVKGPDMLTSLPAVLTRFRQRNIAITGDIKEMFHQVRIRSEDKQAQRFLFRNNPETLPQIYVMDVATFGATCSPCIAQFIKNKNAEQYAETLPEAVEAIINGHYVDDYLESLDTPEEAVERMKQVQYIQRMGGFELRNFLSNSEEVLEELGVTNQLIDKSLLLDPGKDREEVSERVLGMIWKPKTDTFTFGTAVPPGIEPLITDGTIPTKRQVLRTIMSLYDPLGLVAHFIVHGKIMMQEIWKYGASWDEPIPDELQASWIQWTGLLRKLNEVSVPRCFFPGMKFLSSTELQLHVLVDASEAAFASVAYLRIVDNDTPRCALVAAKTKVAPLKPLSMPRSELQAAMIGATLMSNVVKMIKLPVTKRFLWTDSLTVLSWLRTDSRRYHSYVSYRVGEILTKTTVSEWRFVPSKLNVADDATKWGNGPSFSPECRWFTGPDFLHQSEEMWPKDRSCSPPRDELKTVFLNHHGHLRIPLVVFANFSRWDRLLRSMAFVVRAGKKFKKIPASGPITAAEFQAAETFLWKEVQAEVFAEEYAILENNKKKNEQLPLPKSSQLYKLSPYIDEDGVIRMNSRIGAANFAPFEAKYPIILPKNHHLTYLLVNSYHRCYLHCNNETVCNEIHQRFRIPNLRVVVRHVANNCPLCRIRRAKPKPPMMAPLPTGRLAPYTKPFTHTGIDYFGPILVKQNRSLVKRWGALFTCLTIRAVHIEIVHSLSSNSCIMAIRRFVARRGSPLAFYSDNGTNFKGASNILTAELREVHEKCATTFTNASTQWNFNPPVAPHMGGAWERMVRSIKVAMNAIGEHPRNPCDEVLETVALEAEAIVNSRPLTYVPLGNTDAEALTPNHFLLYGEKCITQPIRPVKLDGAALRDSWRLSQTLVDMFWLRWIREYLPVIARRTKWFDPIKPLEAGDVVLIVNEKRRNGWERGLIVEVVKGADGQVRQAYVQSGNGIIRRPATVLALLDVSSSTEGSS